MLSALAVFLCDNYLVIFRLALLFLITKLQINSDIAIECAEKHIENAPAFDEGGVLCRAKRLRR